MLSTAKIASIQGAKKTYEIIPLCHQVLLDHVDLSSTVRLNRIDIEGVSVGGDRIGAEMEAITAVAIATVTICDLCKAADKSITITDIKLLEKTKEEV